jgi:hypothetical protein
MSSPSAPKLAFCVLSYGDVVQVGVWWAFLRDAAPSEFVVVLHRADGGRSSVLEDAFPGQVKVVPTLPTKWGDVSLVTAAQALFDAACTDPTVHKCVLVSGDALPLVPFRDAYESLLESEHGVLDYVAEPSAYHRSRFRSCNLAAWPRDLPRPAEETFPLAHQWCVLTRDQVATVRAHMGWIVRVFAGVFAADEHVYPTLFQALGQMDTFVDGSIMFVEMLQGRSKRCPHGHKHRSAPTTFHTADLTPFWLRALRERGFLFLRKTCEPLPFVPWEVNLPPNPKRVLDREARW